jgi:hypothetical protein
MHFLHCLHFDRVTSFTSFPIYLHYCPEGAQLAGRNYNS